MWHSETGGPFLGNPKFGWSGSRMTRGSPPRFPELASDWSLLQTLIAEQCRRPGPSWLPHLTNDDPTIWGVRPLDDGAFFRNRVLFTASVKGTFLAHRHHPHGGSFGNFAYDGVNLQYLDHRPYQALSELLRTEGRSLNEGDPARLAEVAATVLRLGRVLQTVDDSGPLCGTELSRVSRLMKPPEIAGDRESGWSLRFWSMWYDGPPGCLITFDLYTADARDLRVSSSFAVHLRGRVSHRTVRRFLRRVVS
jgi:hypothetical protein